MNDNIGDTVTVATGVGLALGAATLASGPSTALALVAAGVGLGGMAGNLLTSGIGSLGTNFQRAVLDRFASIGHTDELAAGLKHASTTALRRVIELTFKLGNADPDLARWQKEVTPFCDAALTATPEITAPHNVGDIAITIARSGQGDQTGLQRQLEDWVLHDLGQAINVAPDRFPPEFLSAFRGNSTDANPGWFILFRELVVRQQARDERFARAWEIAMMALLLETVRGLVEVGAPPLDPGSAERIKPTGLDRFVYTRQWTRLVGRDLELARLMTFADPASGEATRFMLIAGPGGRGKSRLALEACQLAATKFGMYAGFLSPRAAPAQGWQHWRPAVPTLIVIDYAASRASEVHDILAALTMPGRPRTHPVRVLLLEREAGLDAAFAAGTNLNGHRTWIDVISGGSSNEALAIEAAYGGELTLAPIADPWPIMAMVFDAKANMAPAKADALAALRVVDPSGSPLFAILVADALAEGEAIGDGDRYQFLRKVIHKQSALPSEAGQRELALNNAAVATLTRQVEASGLLTLYGSHGGRLAPRFRPPDDDMNSVIDAVAALTGHRDGTVLHGLEPDLVGEVLVLSRCEQRDANSIGRAATLRELAWGIPRNNPVGGPIRSLPMAYGAEEMLRLCASDFPEAAIRSSLLEAPGAENAPALAAWATMMRGIINRLVAAGSVDLAGELFEGAIVRAAQRNGSNSSVAVMRLSSAAEIASLLFEAGDYKRALAIADTELARPANRQEEDEFTRRARLELAERYIFSALAIGDIPSAMKGYREELMTAMPLGTARHWAWVLPVCARAIVAAMLRTGETDAAELALRNEFGTLKNTSEIARDVLIGYLKRGEQANALEILHRWPAESGAWKAIELTEPSAFEKEMQERTNAALRRVLSPEVTEILKQPAPPKDLSRQAEWEADWAASAFSIWFYSAAESGWLAPQDLDAGLYIFGWPRREGTSTKKWLVFFDFARAHLTMEGRNTVCMGASSAIFRLQSLNPECSFSTEILGRTDTAEVPSDRAGLSLRRAEAIAKLLVTSGVDVAAITVKGIGIADPMTPTGEAVREPKNRRASIELYHAHSPQIRGVSNVATAERWVWLNKFCRDELCRFAKENPTFPIPTEIARKTARCLQIIRERVPHEFLIMDGVLSPEELRQWLAVPVVNENSDS